MKVWIIFNILLFVSQPVVAQSVSPVEMRVERVGGMTHFEFSGRKNWDYELKRASGKIIVTLPKIQEESANQIRDFKSVLIDKVEIKNKNPNKSEIQFHLADPRVENFDYLTQKPSNLVLDFFVSKDSLISEIKKAKKEVKKKLAQKKATIPNRKPAFAEFFTIDEKSQQNMAKKQDDSPLPLTPTGNIDSLFDFGALTTSQIDDGSLEAKVIEAEGNIYLRFPILQLKNKHLQELQSFRPEYEIKKSFSDENKQARALLALFEKRSFAAFIKGKKIFKQFFPVSKYDEILTYIEADTWIELWKMNKRPEYHSRAMNLYKMLIERHPNSRITERTLINAGLLAHNGGEYFLATKLLRRYLKSYPDSPFTNHIKIYLADSLAHLKNFDGARNALDQVIDADEEGSVQEARYRLGDIYFLKQSFRRAERAYRKAMEKDPRFVSRFPNALFNMAESLFNLAEYVDSLKTYKQFFNTFPNHPYSAYALTRTGELIDILSKDRRKAQGFYNESFFRFRRSTGGTIARMRSLSQRFKDMNKEELQSSIQEIRDLEKAVDLHQVDEFAAFMVSDGYYQRGDYLEAANALIDYFQVNPKPVNIRKFERRISRSIAGEIRHQLKEGQVVPALSIIENHQKSWLSKSRRMDVQFFRAQSYEKMDLFDEALASYDRIEARMKNLSGTKEEKERKIFEYYPSFDQVHLRKAVVLYKRNERPAALAQLNQIKNVTGLDPQSQVDFYFTTARLSFDNKKYADSLGQALKVDASSIEDPETREKFNVFLSEVYERNQKFDKALSILEKFYEKFKGEQDQVYVLSRLFNLYRDKGLTEKAIQTGNTLLTDYSQKYNLDKERYYLGELLFNQGKLADAQKVWKDLTKKSMWSELAANKTVSG
ncbi:MAG: tetratricopeptide repeat protein, partial [Pseudomonadota bacterium]